MEETKEERIQRLVKEGIAKAKQEERIQKLVNKGIAAEHEKVAQAEHEKVVQAAEFEKVAGQPLFGLGDLIKLILFIIIVYAFTQMTNESFSQANSAGTTTQSSGGSTTGTLQIAADSGANIYVGSSYVGKGGAFVTLNPGSYPVRAYSSSTGKLCWEKSISVYSGKNSVVRNDAWCR